MQSKKNNSVLKDDISNYKDITFGKYTISQKLLGRGSFGAVLFCKVKNSHDVCVVKLVNLNISKHNKPDMILKKEVNIYHKLCQHEKLKPYLVKMYAFTEFRNKKNHRCHALVMEFAGMDLEKILEKKNTYRFSRMQLLKIGQELVPAIKTLHEHNIVHCDIKPCNITLKLSKKQNIFQVKLIDYGLARTYKKTNEPKRKKRAAGTPRFCAWKCHFGYSCSPARDMEAFIYTLIYLSGKKLPWHGLKISCLKTKTRTIGFTKRDADTSRLCSMLDKPLQVDVSLGELLKKTRTLKYNEIPDYAKFFLYFKKSLELNNSESDSSFSSHSFNSCQFQTNHPAQQVTKRKKSNYTPTPTKIHKKMQKKTHGR